MKNGNSLNIKRMINKPNSFFLSRQITCSSMISQWAKSASFLEKTFQTKRLSEVKKFLP